MPHQKHNLGMPKVWQWQELRTACKASQGFTRSSVQSRKSRKSRSLIASASKRHGHIVVRPSSVALHLSWPQTFFHVQTMVAKLSCNKLVAKLAATRQVGILCRACESARPNAFICKEVIDRLLGCRTLPCATFA